MVLSLSQSMAQNNHTATHKGVESGHKAFWDLDIRQNNEVSKCYGVEKLALLWSKG